MPERRHPTVQKLFSPLFFLMPATPSLMEWLFVFFLCILLASVSLCGGLPDFLQQGVVT